MRTTSSLAAAAFGLALSIGAAHAQTSPNLSYEQVLTPAQWNTLFANKQDVLGFSPVNSAGGVLTGRLVTAAPSGTTSGLSLTPGSTPGSPVSGDVWVTSVGMFVRVNGATVGPLVASAKIILRGVNFNSANTDTAATVVLPSGFARYAVASVKIVNASATLTTATVGMFSAAAAGGTPIVASGSAVTVSSAAANTNNNMQTLTPANAATQSFNFASLFFRVQTAEGSAATADVIIEVVPLS